MEAAWRAWFLFRFVELLFTTPAVLVAVYLIFRKRGARRVAYHPQRWRG